MGFLAVVETSQIHNKQTKTPLKDFNLKPIYFPFHINTIVSSEFCPALGFVIIIRSVRLLFKEENQKLFQA